MKEILVLLTFDYELPLGEASDYDQAMFNPTSKLLRLAEELQVPVVLFADVCAALAFRKWGEQSYYNKFAGQLQQALKSGHDVQLHIHPHWLTSTFNQGRFIPSRDYSLSHFAKTKDSLDLEGIIETAFVELNTICGAVIPGYQCVAYRAGGYDIEPDSARIIKKLSQLGIKVDSSVIKDFYIDYGFTKVDYRGAPDDSFWKVGLNGPMIGKAKDGVLELPISGKPVGAFDIVRRRVNKLIHGKQLAGRVHQNGGRGLNAVQGKQRASDLVRKLFNPTVLSFDKEHLETNDLLDIVSYLDNHHKAETNSLVVTAIGHPKSMGPYHLDLFAEFVRQMRKTHGNRVSFTTYQEIVKRSEFNS